MIYLDHKVRPLRDAQGEGILSSIPNAELNSHKSQQLANTNKITFHGIESEASHLYVPTPTRGRQC